MSDIESEDDYDPALAFLPFIREIRFIKAGFSEETVRRLDQMRPEAVIPTEAERMTIVDPLEAERGMWGDDASIQLMQNEIMNRMREEAREEVEARNQARRQVSAIVLPRRPGRRVSPR